MPRTLRSTLKDTTPLTKKSVLGSPLEAKKYKPRALHSSLGNLNIPETHLSDSFGLEYDFRQGPPRNLSENLGNIENIKINIPSLNNFGINPEDSFYPELFIEAVMPNNEDPAFARHHLRPKDALPMIPTFSGLTTGCSYRDFAAACLDAKRMINPNSEVDLTYLLRAKLTDGPLQIVRDNDPQNITQLLQIIKKIYAPRESSEALQRELSLLCQKPQEKVANYFHRTRALANRIIEAFKNDHDGAITEGQKEEIEKKCCKAFSLGLDRELCNLVKETESLNKLGPEAIELEQRLELQNNLRNLSLKENSKCAVCEENTHLTRNCPLINKETTSVERCRICNQIGHIARYCNEHNNSNQKCQLCNSTGHIARNCPRNRSNINSTRCRICNRFGHEAINCRSNRSQAICQICHQPGHKADECRHYTPIRATRINSCDICKMSNHITSQCRKNKPCFKCNKPGHFPQDCKSMVCQLCKQVNHTARDCPQIPKRPTLNCQYCLRDGHTADKCWKLQSPVNPLSQKFCSFCKSNDHSVESCTTRQIAIANFSGNELTLPTGEGNPIQSTSYSGLEN